MQKKKINIVLLLAVLTVWGTVGYRFIKGYFVSDNRTNYAVAKSESVSIKNIKKDTFDLTPLNHDPFLNKPIQNSEAINTSINKKPILNGITTKKVKAPIPVFVPEVKYFPEVKYYGYIKSQQKTNELILIKIDSKLHKVRKNDNVDGLVISKIFKDSIEVMIGKEKRNVYLK